jgi:hypothetical protein
MKKGIVRQVGYLQRQLTRQKNMLNPSSESTSSNVASDGIYRHAGISKYLWFMSATAN